MRKRIPLEEGEEIEIRSAGALSSAASGRWRLGEWIKTDKRILFLQGGNLSFATALDLLVCVEKCEREYSFGKKQCLKAVLHGEDGPFWFIVPDVKLWQERLSKHLRGVTTGEAFCDVIDEGDFYRVIIETPEFVDVAIDGGQLKLTGMDGYRNLVALPEDVLGLKSKSYQNGFLELHLDKRPPVV